MEYSIRFAGNGRRISIAKCETKFYFMAYTIVKQHGIVWYDVDYETFNDLRRFFPCKYRY